MKELKIFEFNTTKIRTIELDDQVWFVASDVCLILEHTDTSKAVGRLDDDEKGTTTILTLGGNQDVLIINESGLYSLVLTSRKPEAKKFKKWITSEVLPSIRKTGGFQYNLPQTFSEALRRLADETEAKETALAKIESDKPKVAFAEAVRRLDGCCSVGDFAKAIGTWQNRLFKRLRDDGFLMVNNRPFQCHIERGLMEVIEQTPYVDRDGKSHPAFKTVITGKGQVFFEKRYRIEVSGSINLIPEPAQ